MMNKMVLFARRPFAAQKSSSGLHSINHEQLNIELNKVF